MPPDSKPMSVPVDAVSPSVAPAVPVEATVAPAAALPAVKSVRPARIARKAAAKKVPAPPVAVTEAAAPELAKPTKSSKASKPVKAPVKVPSKKAVSQKVAPKKVATKVAKVLDKAPKLPKSKLVRDSFTMPAAEFALIAQLKARALGFQRETKKSELLRAGLQALAVLSDAQLKKALSALLPLKAGRPKKND